MPFHSPNFLLLCLVTFLLYYRGGERWQHVLLAIASLAFYYYAGLPDTLLLVSTVALNHWLVKRVARSRGQSRSWLHVAVVANLAILGFFKYRSMLAEWASHLGLELAVPGVIIPLGISFYVFQLIAYQVDVSRGALVPEPAFWRTFLYIVFFPHHQAGPIMRPAKFLPQFYGTKQLNWEGIASGGLWILWGLTKKVGADHLAVYVDQGFGSATAVSDAGSAWLLAVRYAIQIYGDFSGYSDIAVGLGLLFGYRLDRNFNQPYLASTPAEFWARWHITLSQWLRDYLYIPLGGNRLGQRRTLVNLMLTMVLGGLWHGASAMFLLWGLVHGGLLVLHRVLPGLFRVRPLGWLLTFAFTILAWVPFRAPTWPVATNMLGAMFGTGGLGPARAWMLLAATLLVFLVLHGLENAVLETEASRSRAELLWTRIPAFARGCGYAAVIVGVVTELLDKTTYIYFRF